VIATSQPLMIIIACKMHLTAISAFIRPKADAKCLVLNMPVGQVAQVGQVGQVVGHKLWLTATAQL